MNYKFKLNLQVKWTMYIAVIIFFTAGIGILLFVKQGIKDAKETLQQKGIILAENLAYNSKYGVLAENKDLLSGYIKGIIKIKEVSCAAVYNSKGSLLAYEGRDSNDSKKHDLSDSKELSSIEHKINSGSYLDIVVPVTIIEEQRDSGESGLFMSDNALVGLDEKKEDSSSVTLESALFEKNIDKQEKIIGKVLIEMSESITLAKIQKMRNISILIAFLIMMIAIGVIILMVKAMVKPINSLVEATQKAAKGDFDSNVAVQRNDELGMLGNAFNAMLRDLKITTVSRDTLVVEVNERKKSENALKQSEKELVEYSKQLTKTNKELDEFIHIISHDLKEPLRAIDAYSAFINKDFSACLNDDGKNYLARIKTNAGRVQLLIENIYELVRIEKNSIQLEKTEIENIIHESAYILDHSIKEKNAEIIIKNRLPVITCDRNGILKVFVNLISNAVKFSNKKKLVIEIGCRNHDGFYQLYVKDNGPGIEEKYYDKIFVIFQRLGKREDFEGTGTGLTVSKRIIEKHNGSIWVESILGEGSTFYVALPNHKGGIQ
ncbi:MAG: ATP-binding protein [bacterium]